jgi:hypothetical protein
VIPRSRPTWARDLLLLLCSVLLPAVAPGYGLTLWSDEARERLNVGLKLFPACLAADRSLDTRLTANDKLLLLVAYDDDPAVAARAAARLRRLGKIRGHALEVRSLPLEQLARYRKTPIGGLFLATPDVPELMQLPGRLHTLVFSPFLGAVERGAVAGIHVAERILPYVNLQQARRAGVRFKPFFLQVAKPYE